MDALNPHSHSSSRQRQLGGSSDYASADYSGHRTAQSPSSSTRQTSNTSGHRSTAASAAWESEREQEPQPTSVGVLQAPGWKGLSWPAVAIATGSLAATTVGLAHRAVTQPTYEGRIQLAIDPAAIARYSAEAHSALSHGLEASAPETFSPERAASESRTSASSVSKALETRTDASATAEAPDVLSEALVPVNLDVQVEFLKSPDIIVPVLDQLKAQEIHLTPDELVRRITLHAVDGGILEISYEDARAETVRQVLESLAKVYLAQEPTCELASCQSFEFIEAQMAQTQRTITDLQEKLDAFRTQHGLPPTELLHGSVNQVLQQFVRQRQDIASQLAQATASLQQAHADLGLDDETLAFEIMGRSPHYRDTLQQWRQVNQQLIQLWVTSSSDESQRQTLEQRHEQLIAQLYQEIHQTIENLRLMEMPPDLRHVVIDQPRRMTQIEPWLADVQRVYLLQQRQQALEQMASHLEQRLQERQAIAQQHDRLQEQLSTAVNVLSHYQHRYNALLPHVVQRQVAWQLVSPPEIIQAKADAPSIISWLPDTLTKH